MRERAFERLRGTRLYGNGIRFFHGTTGYGIRDFPFFTGHGIGDTGFHILHGTTGYGIRDFAFFTGPRDNRDSRTIPRDLFRGKTPGKALDITTPAHLGHVQQNRIENRGSK